MEIWTVPFSIHFVCRGQHCSTVGYAVVCDTSIYPILECMIPASLRSPASNLAFLLDEPGRTVGNDQSAVVLAMCAGPMGSARVL